MIYVLPGMGADQRMYPTPWDTLPNCTFLSWPKYTGEQSLTAVAEKIVRTHDIRENAWLVGSSLGGMVAAEITALVPIKGLVLIGSACSSDEIGSFLRFVSPLIDLAPLPFIQQAVGKAPSELTRMFKDSDPAFIRAMCHAIARWEGSKSATPIFRIHGRRDLVIPLPAKVDHVVDGGHLIAMTHPQECVDALCSLLRSNA